MGMTKQMMKFIYVLLVQWRSACLVLPSILGKENLINNIMELDIVVKFLIIASCLPMVS